MAEYASNGFILPQGVIILHISVWCSLAPSCTTTPKEGYYITCNLGNITIERDMGNIVICCLGNGLYMEICSLPVKIRWCKRAKVN